MAVVLNAVAGLLGLVPVDLASAIMGWLWRRLAPLNERHRRADTFLAAAMPELSREDRRRILGDMWENLGRTAIETIRLPEMIADRGRFELAVEALEPHRAAMAGGAVFATLHQGNWEFSGWGIRLFGFPTAAVYRPLRNPIVEDFLRAKRAPIYDAGLYPADRVAALRLRSLARRGVAIGMVADLKDRTGIEAPFFGRRAMVATFPATLARRLGLPLIAGRTLRTRGANFRIEAVRVDVPYTQDAEADVAAATLALHGQFEAWIRERPEQWMWATRKWIDPA